MEAIFQTIANRLLPSLKIFVYVVYAVENDKMKEMKVFTKTVKAQDEYERLRKIYKGSASFCGLVSKRIL